jgi:hypothetical protein
VIGFRIARERNVARVVELADTPDLGFFLDRFFGFLGIALKIHKTIVKQCVYGFHRVFQVFKCVLEKWP